MLVLRSDQMLTCPLDESHRIRKERMQFHLVKCLKNHSLEKKLKCPWNPLHIIDQFAWKDHWMHECENLPAALESMCQTEPSRDLSSVPIDTSPAVIFPSDEDWDADPYVGTYEPFKAAAEKPVLRSMIGLSKAKKKQWIQAERRRHQELEANGPLKVPGVQNTQTTSKSSCAPLRVPRTKAATSSIDVSIAEDLNSTEISDKNEPKKKPKAQEPVKLRLPHAPSPVVSMKPKKPKNVSDESFAANNTTIDLRAETTELMSDAASMISGVSCTSSRRAHLEIIRQKLLKTSAADTKKSTNGIDNDLSQRLAELTTMENSIRDERAAVINRMSKIVPKLINPEASRVASTRETGSSAPGSSNGEDEDDIESVIPSLTSCSNSEKKFANPIPRCAAAFPGPRVSAKNANKIKSGGAGRGTIVDFSAFDCKTRAPGKENSSGNTPNVYTPASSFVGPIGGPVFGFEDNDD